MERPVKHVYQHLQIVTTQLLDHVVGHAKQTTIPLEVFACHIPKTVESDSISLAMCV